jgi:hypothetical protein
MESAASNEVAVREKEFGRTLLAETSRLAKSRDVNVYLTAYFALGSSAFRRVTKIPTPAIRQTTPRVPATGIVLCSTLTVDDSVALLVRLFGVIDNIA